MASVLTDLGVAFVLGLLTPLTAVCVLPLYPGFLSYLANQLGGSESKWRILLLGTLVSAGVILFMLLLGIIFTLVLKQSLTSVVGIVSPIAFGILAIVSLLLIFNVDFGRFMPKAASPDSKNPLLNALLFGFFFGAIVVPCNPGFIIALLVQVSVSPVASILTFLAFGLGIAAPLLALAAISGTIGRQAIHYLIEKKRTINLIAGIFMLIVSIYYLLCVFAVVTDFGICNSIGNLFWFFGPDTSAGPV